MFGVFKLVKCTYINLYICYSEFTFSWKIILYGYWIVIEFLVSFHFDYFFKCFTSKRDIHSVICDDLHEYIHTYFVSYFI